MNSKKQGVGQLKAFLVVMAPTVLKLPASFIRSRNSLSHSQECRGEGDKATNAVANHLEKSAMQQTSLQFRCQVITTVMMQLKSNFLLSCTSQVRPQTTSFLLMYDKPKGTQSGNLKRLLLTNAYTKLACSVNTLGK